MNLVESTIKQIIEDQGYLYFRSVNINDLNEQVGNTDIAQGIGVYSSLPAINNITYQGNLNILMEYDIEVYYLKLNTEIDDKGEAVDVLLNDLYPDAQQFYDRIRQSGIVAQANFVDSYSLDATETLKLTKEVLTGWRIRMTIPIFRNDFYCTPLTPPPLAVVNSVVAFNVTLVQASVDSATQFNVGQQYRVITDDGNYNFTASLQSKTASNLRFPFPYTVDAGTGFIYDPF